MKLKTVFAASLLVGSVAFADSTEVTAEYVLGVMPLTVGEETIISIPWVESGTTNSSQTISVTNIIKTANLAVGDCLLWYTNGEYQAWTVQNGSPKYWAPADVAAMGRVDPSAGTEDQVLSRGDALILHRGSSTSTNIYVVGQYSAGNGSLTMTAGATDSPVFTLFAPPTVSATGINSLTWTKETINSKDYIVLADGTQVKYDASEEKWIAYSYDEYGRLVSNDIPTIPVGTGAWYVSKGGSPTVSW